MKRGMSSETHDPRLLRAGPEGLRPTSGRAYRSLLILLTALAACTAKHQEQSLLVAAAASLRDVATELGEAFRRRTGTRVDFNFAGSNVLAQQIVAANQVDAFLSADQRWIDFVADNGRIVAGSSRTILRNRLVVIARKDSELPIQAASDLATCDYQHLVVADPEAVPAGRYSKAWLEQTPHQDGNLWDAVRPRLTPTSDVRATLALVESDPRFVGIVYASDQRTSEQTQVLFEPADDQQPDIEYGAVLIRASDTTSAAGQFLEFLASREAQATFRRHGFGVPE